MRKNKLSYIFTILTIICIFSVAAIADQCGCRATPVEEKIDVGETKETAEEEVSSEVEEENSEEVEEEQAEETAEEETSEAEEEQESTESDEQAEAPSIELEVYEGPVYSSSDNVCYYRIKATVTGNPNPAISFSKDDSGGAWGKYKTQINLDDPADTYTLTATATNSEGDVTDSIDLSWGCNRPPLINSITINNGDKIYTSERYDVSVEVSDPEGEDLQFKWGVNGGKIDNPTSNPAQWVTPSTASEYQLEVAVEDGSGGMATISKTVIVEQLEVEIDMSLPIVEGEGGFIAYNQQVVNGGTFYTGDLNTNAHCKGYISFDITGLSGANVEDAAIYFNNKRILDDPSFFKIFLIHSVNWGAILELSDYNTPGELIDSYPLGTGPDFSCGNTKLKMELQQAIDSGRVRLQIMIDANSALTDGDGINDGLEYDISGVNLSVDYTP